MWSLTSAASACDGSRASAAKAASGSCPASACAKASCAKSATTATAARRAAKATKSKSMSAFVPLPSNALPLATTAFPGLPSFQQPAPIVAGLLAFIDPETGLLTGPIGDLSVPEDVARQFATPVDLTPVTLPDGSLMIDLQGSLQDYYVLHIDPLGRRTVRCVQDLRHAQIPPAAPILLPTAER
jgi:hypothetical protein